MTATEIRIGLLRMKSEEKIPLDSEKQALTEVQVALLEIADDLEEGEWDPDSLSFSYIYNHRSLEREKEKLEELKLELEKKLSESSIIDNTAKDEVSNFFGPSQDSAQWLRLLLAKGGLDYNTAKKYLDLCIGYWRAWKNKNEFRNELELSLHENAASRLDSLLQLRNEIVKYLPSSSDGAELTDEEEENVGPGSIRPIVWKGGPAALAWIYDALIANKMIDCSTSAFAAVFTNPELKPMPGNLKDYTKNSREPKKQTIKDLYFAVSNFKTDDTRE